MENHYINIENRQLITITEVADIDSFDEEVVYTVLKEGELIVKGKSLHIQKLDLEEGKAIIEGEITSLEYTKRKDSEGKGLLKRILK